MGNDRAAHREVERRYDESPKGLATRLRYRQSPERREYKRQWYLAHKDLVAKWGREWRQANPRGRRAQALSRLYGMTLDQYDAQVVAQQGRCAICRKVEPLEVDHSHQTDKVRGLLCGRCNRAVGLFKDDPGAMRAAATYLEAQ